MQKMIFNDIAKENIDIILRAIIALKDTNIFLFSGEIGAGKTFLISSIINFLSANNAPITSPSFSFINEYNINGAQFYHYDLYFREKNDDFAIFFNSLLNDGLHFVEWGTQEIFEKLKQMDFNVVFIKILESNNNNARNYEIIY